MAVNSNTYFDKARSRRTVFKRTRNIKELPKLVLYMETVVGRGQRKVLDTEGAEHVLDEKVLMSDYKYVSKQEAKDAIEEHWKDQKPKPVKSA